MIKILIADDEPLVRAGIKSVIPWESNGFEIIGEAWDGEDAYQKVISLHPDILITDIKMPGMDGITLLKKLRNKNIPIKTIILSCFDDFDFVREGMKYGAHDYILKLSVEPQKLLDILNEIKVDIQTKESEISLFLNSDLKYLFIKKLLKQKFLSEEHIKNAIFNMGLNISLRDYKLIQLRTKNLYSLHNSSEAEAFIYNILDSICKRHPGNEIFLLDNGDFLIIHSSGNWKLLRTQISASLKEYANSDVFFGSSERLNDYTDFKEGMLHSKEALSSAVFYNENHEITYFSICPKPIATLTDKQEERLYQALLKNHTEEALKLCQSFLLKIKEDIYLLSECFSYIEKILAVYDRFAQYFRFSIDSVTLRQQNIYEYIQHQTYFYQWQEAFFEFTEKLTNMIFHSHALGERNEIFSIKEFIKLNYRDNINLNRLAELVNISPAHLSALFKKETGKNFSSYLTEIRMREAKRLLKNPHAVIFEVAEQTGYANSGYFGKAFKKFYGITPEEYKKALKEENRTSGKNTLFHKSNTKEDLK